MTMSLQIMLGIGAGFFGVGAILLKRGLWGGRLGETPYCGGCGYNLTGSTGERCPECGLAITPDGIVRGERPRRWGLVSVAGVLLVAGSGILLYESRQVNWYEFMPTALVMNDLKSGNSPKAVKAWKELMRRDGFGSLSEGQQERLIEACLKEQVGQLVSKISVWIPARSTQSGEMLDFLGDCYLDGRLSKQQEDTFFNQMVDPKLIVRPKVFVDNKVPVRMQIRCRGPMNTGFWMSRDQTEILLDGKPAGIHLGADSGFVQKGVGSASDPSIRRVRPGKHTVSVPLTWTIYHGPPWTKDLNASRVCYKKTTTVSAEFEVIDDVAGDPIKFISNAKTDGEFAANFSVSGVRIERTRQGKRRLRVEIGVATRPVDFAFEVFARWNEEETLLGNFTGHASLGTWMPSIVGDYDGPDVDSVDILFRSSEEAARRTPDLFEIWEGELVFEDVPVEIVTTGAR